MTRSQIPAEWLDAHAFAGVTLWRHGRPDDARRLFDRVQVGGQCWHGVHLPARETYRWSVLALADAAEAVLRLVKPEQHPGGFAVQFTNLDDGQPMDPGDFLYDADGRAAVWAARAVVAAANGDQDTITSLVATVAELPASADGIAAALLHYDRVTVGAAPLVALQVDADNLADMERTLSGAKHPTHAWRCADRCYVAQGDERNYTGNRDVRELAAAEHVLNYAHIVTRETRWT